MSNSTITADLPRVERRGGSAAQITIGGGGTGGGWSPTLFPGPIADTKGQRKLNPHVFRHNTRTPAPFSHGVVTGHSYTQENNQAIFAVNKHFIAIAGSNQYNDLGDNNAAGYSYLGYKVSTPFQWMGQQGEFAVRIVNKEMQPDEWPSNWSGYDTRFLWLEKDAFDIVSVIPGYTKFVLLKCGVAFAIGYNGHGQCGDGGTSNRQSWRMVSWSSSYEGVQEDQRIYKNGRKIVQMCSTSNGQDNTASTQYALTDDGRLWGWGYNGYGQTGTNNSTTNNGETYSPHQFYRDPKSGESGLQPATDAVYVVCATDQYGSVIYIDADSHAWGAGRNNNYPLGIGYGNNQTYFRPLGHNGQGDWYDAYGGRKLVKVAMTGGGDNCSVLWLFDDSSVGESGYMGYGSLGGSTAGTNGFRDLSATFGPSDTKGKAVNVWMTGNGYMTQYVETEDGKLYGAGYSGYDQLSNGRSAGANNGVHEIDFWAVGNGGTLTFNGEAPRIAKLDFSGRGSTTTGVCLLEDGTVMALGRNSGGQRGGLLQAGNSYWWNQFGHGRKCIDVDAMALNSDAAAILPLDAEGHCWGAGDYRAVPNLYWNAGSSHRNAYMPILVNNAIGR